MSQTEALVLAADIGGTHMRAALVEHNGEILVHRTVPTPAHDDAPAALVDLIRIRQRHERPAEAVPRGRGASRRRRLRRGQLLWAPHLPETWTAVLSSDELTSRLGLPVFIANDADLAAVGEATFGAGVGTPDVAYLTISTGIGAGIISGGRLLRGRRSLAEVGHTVIDWHAWCAGRPSTLEQLGSGSGMARAGLPPQASEISMPAPSSRRPASGDRTARDIRNRAVAACAVGICNLVMTFSPSTVVVGGGIGRQEDFFAAAPAMVVSRPAHHPTGSFDRSVVAGRRRRARGCAAWMAATSCSFEWDSSPY